MELEELYQQGLEYFENRNYVEALRCFSKTDILDSKKYENKCIDILEDLIYYSRKKKALDYLEQLKFYADYSYFTDAYKRRRINWISKILMFGSAILGTIILIIFCILN